MRSVAAIICAAAILTSSPVEASVSGWHYGKWQLVIGTAENIVVLAQDGENIEVEARTDGGSEVRIGFHAVKCGAGSDERVVGDSFRVSRSTWDRIPPGDRLRMLKWQFQGWVAQADFLCPARRHSLDLRKLGEALRQFDGQLAMIGG